MNEFYNYFSNYIDKDDLSEIGFGEITRLVLYREDRRALIEVVSQKLLDSSLVERVQKSIGDGLKLNKIDLKIKYPKSLFSLEDIEKILSPVRLENQMVNGFFDGVEAEIEDNVLTIFLKNGGKEILEKQGIDKAISNYIYSAFDFDIDVSFMEVQSFDVEKAVHEAYEQKREQEKAIKEEQEKNAVHTILGDTPLYGDTRKVVFGRNIRELPKPIKDVKYDDGVITVWGDILKSECRDTRRGDSKILTFDISDYTSSITVKIFDRNDVVAPILMQP